MCNVIILLNKPLEEDIPFSARSKAGTFKCFYHTQYKQPCYCLGAGEVTCIFNKIVAFFAISTGMIMHFSAAGEMEEMIENHQLITTLMFHKLQDPPVKNSKILNMFISISQPKYLFFFSVKDDFNLIHILRIKLPLSPWKK